MKVYGFTQISSENLGNGTLSQNDIYINKDLRNEAIYRRYISEQFFLRDAGYLSSKYDKRPKEEIIKDIDKDNGHLKLVYGENFIQFESWERDL